MEEDNSLGNLAIKEVSRSRMAFCRFLTANDTGETGGHQDGIYISKPASPILFDSPGIRGDNKDRFVKIRWQNDFDTVSRFIYYGVGTRNEYRITRFGKGFPFLEPEHTGDLFVLSKMSENEYSAVVLEKEDDINEFLCAFGMMPSDTGNLINKDDLLPQIHENVLMEEYISGLPAGNFPSTLEISEMARNIVSKVQKPNAFYSDPDGLLLLWVDKEYSLFKEIEKKRYEKLLHQGFQDLDSFVETALEIINRRKSRAGKSFEHHLSSLFHRNLLKFEEQAVTEGNKKPDFIFPDAKSYHNMTFPADQLIFLGAKTTCKDRWRQILNEADRIPVKHLCTLQQGISSAQLKEMDEAHVILVVPERYIKDYPKQYRDKIWTLSNFIGYVQEKQQD